MAVPKRDAAFNQLAEYARKHSNDDNSITTTFGTPVPEKDSSLTVGYHGPVLLQDWFSLDELAHFSRERIPERVVHARGAGAFGYFEVTHDITKYTAATVFAQIGKKTPVGVRFSQVAGELGYADTVRDIRGFALKFYTEDGIWDITGNNQPVFFVRDFVMFPSLIHVMKRNPKTHIRLDYDMFWDFLTLRPETTHTTMIFFSDRGIPDSFRKQHGYGVNTYAFVNAQGKFNYCKFHWLSNQGIGTLTSAEAQKIAGIDPDFHIRDLYNAIANGNFPSWNFYIQIMTPEQAAKSEFDPFDDTKVWPHGQYPLIPVGKIVLNRNPENYFAEVEQIGFDPAHLIPGIEPSPDRMLQGRLFAYGDTQRHRLGPNHIQLPVNCPFHVHNYDRDGRFAIHNQGGAPNYHPNTFNGPVNDKRAQALTPQIPLQGVANRIDSVNEDNFTQARVLYQRVMKPDEKTRLVQNIVSFLVPTTSALRERAIDLFAHVDESLAQRIRDSLKATAIEQHVNL
ncbi:hypothetical protein NQ315_008511 [Exocentrus adspersus]|uniref:Catalase n=1 Tax=Exocentrus adspersus TaxID=1586481 RepID=A0AAV8W5F3_9CUCU|nr:hypothetical protein NQ315_008511 [Exocentrus adspersus]